MLAIFGIIFGLNFILGHSDTIEWKAYKPKSFNKTNDSISVIELPVSFYRGNFKVPADHEAPDTSPQLNIHVRKICNSTNPDWNIILLPGGPGQSARAYIKSISAIYESLKDISFCLYAIDHRGVGKSTRLGKKDLISDIEEISQNPNFPIQTLTIANAAKDTLKFIEILKNESKSSNIKLGLIGTSYGSMLAHRVLSINPNVFDVCVLDGYSPPESCPIDDDEGVILDFKESPICMEKLGPNPEYIRNVPSYIADRNFNACTKILFKDLLNKFYVKHGFNQWKQLQVYLRIAFLIDKHKTLAMVHHTWACPDSVIYEKALKNFNEIIVSRKSLNAFELDSSDGHDDGIIKVYMIFNEMFRSFYEDRLNNPKKEYQIGLFHQNPCFEPSDIESYELIRKHLSPTLDPLHNKPIETEKTRVYLVHGRKDGQTPLASALKEFNRIKAADKQSFILNHQGHAIAFGNPCRNQIMNAIFSQSNSSQLFSIANECVARENKPMEFFNFKEKDPKLEILWAQGDNLRPLPEEPYKSMQ